MAGSSSPPIVICGGGIIGCATAYYLAKRGVKSIILEATGIASAASGKSGGFLARDWCKESPLNDLATNGFQLHMELADEFVDCGYQRVDTLSVTSKEGFRNKVSDIPPWLRKCVQAASSIGTQENTAQVNPYKLCNTFPKKAKELVGTEVKICKVEEFRIEGGRIIGVEISGKEVIAADRVLIAMGPWCSKNAVQALGVPNVLIHKSASIVMGQLPTTLTPHSLFMSYTVISAGDKKENVEWHARRDGTLYVCGNDNQEPLPDTASEVKPSPHSISHIKEIVEDVSPGFTSNVITEQACYLPFTEDTLPLIGKVPNIVGLYIATGHRYWGILASTSTGKAVAELILDDKCTLLDLSKFDPGRNTHRH